MCILVFFLATILHNSLCANILGVFPTPSFSHQVVFQRIWKELSLRGHKVIVFTPNPLNDTNLTNLIEIDMKWRYSFLGSDYVGDTMAKDLYILQSYTWLFSKLEIMTEEHFREMKNVFKNNKIEFDLIIAETLHPLVYGLGCRFKTPIIGVSSLGLFPQMHDAVGNPTHPVLTPDSMANIMVDVNLYEKICSILHNLVYRIWYYWYILPRSDQIAKKYFGEECPHLGDIIKNVSLLLVNTNPITNFARPLVPNMAEISRMHIKIQKSLPKDLQKYLDSSKEGVIYFNLGSNVRSDSLPVFTKKIILEVLSEVPYNVLWKWEGDDIPDKPKNVMIQPWYPQQDILRHKNIKVFVTQGGQQSFEEAITYGVPMVGIPFIADQPMNMMKMVKLGIGKSLNHVTMTKEELKEAITDVAENEKYRQKIQDLKNLFVDRPITYLENSIWLVESILKHKGVTQSKTRMADMSYFEYFLLDVLVLIFTFILFCYFICRLFKMSFKFVRRN